MCGFCGAAALSSACGVEGFGKLSAPLDARAGNGSVVTPFALTIPGDETTTATIAIGETITERLETVGDTDWYRIELTAGDIIQVDLTRAGADPLEDPQLGLYDSNGTLVAFNDDIILGVDQESLLFFEVLESGTYFIEAGSFDNSHDGDYQLSVAVAPPGADTLKSSPLYTGLFTNEVMATGETSAQGAMEVRYYFATTQDTFSSGSSFTADQNWTSYEKQQIELALDLYEQSIDVQFIEVTNKAQADLKFLAGEIGAGNLFSTPSPGDDERGFLGFAFFPGTSEISSLVALNIDGFGWDRSPAETDIHDDGLEPGGTGFATIVHEIGHAFGLDHPFESFQSSIFPGLLDGNDDGTADDPFNDSGDFALNQDVYTIMSYRNGWTDHPRGPARNTAQGFTESRPASPMAIDLAVLQDIYGANQTFASGNNIYTLEDVTDVRSKFEAIWDTGGTDEIRYSGNRDAVIDLRAATLRVEDGGGGFVSHTESVRGGYTIARGVEIENATGGAGDDNLVGNQLANTLDGGSDGEDTITGNGGDDVLYGRAGKDSLFGGADDDVLYGGSESDILDGGEGDNTLFGGDEDDTFLGGLGNDLIYGGGGGDLFRAGARVGPLDPGDASPLLGLVTVFGGEGEDTARFDPLSSDPADLTIDLTDPSQSTGVAKGVTLVDVERIEGAKTGANTYFGDAGHHTFVGGSVADLLYGGDGNDRLMGEEGEDRLFGDAGNDLLDGQEDDDTVFGGAGNDFIDGSGGLNLLYGGDGSDFFNLFGSDVMGAEHVLYGGEGSDTAYFQMEGSSAFYGGEGLDYISYDSVPVGAFVSLAIADGFTVLESVEGLIGTIEDDALTGDDGDNHIVGLDGGDLIYGGAGNDTLEPGPNDTFLLFTVDVVYGGEGDDTIIAGIDEDTLFGGSGLDVWSFAGETPVSASLAAPGLTVLDSIEGLIGGSGNDTLTGDDQDNLLIGGGGGDTLDGGDGDDIASYAASSESVVVFLDGSTAIGGDADGDVLADIENLLGSAFADFLRGDGQANVLTGGAGADYIQGRGGDDTLNGGENDDLLEPGAGADTVDGGAGQDLLSALDAAGPVTINLGNVALSSAGYADKTLISIEGVLGVAGFGNTLVGGGGEDLLIGGDVADSIAGAGGADILLGLGGADTISGGAGDDLILGLEGDDVLTGDAGRDLFLFEPGDGADVVTDFELPVGGAGFEDRLFFSGLGLTFADLDIAEVGGDVVIGYGTNPAAFDGSVTVEGVTLAELVPGGAQPDWILVF